MNRKMKIKLLAGLLTAVIAVSCKKYEQFTKDFDYTTAYFAYQNPVRTVFANHPEIEIGAVMGGRRDNQSSETVSYRIAPELLTNTAIVGSRKFELLPADYYTISDPGKFTIPAGDVLGRATLRLNPDKFLADPKALTNTYALPLLITETSLDSVLAGGEGIPRKDYTVIVIKYISEFHGTYYHHGQREKFNPDGSLVDVKRYVTQQEEQEFIVNRVWNLATAQANILTTDGQGEFLTGSGRNYGLTLTVSQDLSVGIADRATSLIKNVTDLGNSRFDRDKKAFYLNYQFIDAENFRHVMKDTLYFRNDGLKLGTW